MRPCQERRLTDRSLGWGRPIWIVGVGVQDEVAVLIVVMEDSVAGVMVLDAKEGYAPKFGAELSDGRLASLPSECLSRCRTRHRKGAQHREDEHYRYHSFPHVSPRLCLTATRRAAVPCKTRTYVHLLFKSAVTCVCYVNAY